MKECPVCGGYEYEEFKEVIAICIGCGNDIVYPEDEDSDEDECEDNDED